MQDHDGGARPLHIDPVTSLRAVSRLLKVSEDTIARRRRERGCTMEHFWWESPAAVVEWWKALNAPRTSPPTARRARKGRAARSGVYDASVLAGDDR